MLGARGIEGEPAPSWGVREWINLPEGAETLDVEDYRGKVLYLFGFQSWCPGCHARGLPTLQKLVKRYEGIDDVAFVAVQTVFEGYSSNTAERAWETARQYELEIPVGHDGTAGNRSVLMKRYRTGGTPWVVVIDKSGTVRYNDFHITVPKARTLIDGLRAEPAIKVEIETLPAGRGGQDLVGTSFPKLTFDRWLREDRAGGETPKATLYRWWTDTCPYCEASLPAVEQLRRRYAPKGLRVVGVYHPKPPRVVDDGEIRATAVRLGYGGAIAVDEDWSELDELYLSKGRRRATSVSFLVDADGVIRFVHPGPIYFPSEDPRNSRENADYQLLEKAIRTLVE